MTLESIVTSLDLSKQLKEAGFKQKSLFYWVNLGEFKNHVWQGDDWKPFQKKTMQSECGLDVDDFLPDAIYSAYTATELGEILPKYIDNIDLKKLWELKKPPKENISVHLCISYGKSGWLYFYMEELHGGICLGHSSDQWDKSEANARAKLCLYLKSKGLLNE